MVDWRRYDVREDVETSVRSGARRRASCPVIRVRTWKYDPGSSRVRATAHLPGTDETVGEVVAVLRQESGRKVLSIEGASVEEDLVGCGIGTRLYEAAARHACREGATLVSDRSLTVHSRSFWDKQVGKGRATWDGSEQRYELRDSCKHIDLSGLKCRRRRRR